MAVRGTGRRRAPAVRVAPRRRVHPAGRRAAGLIISLAGGPLPATERRAQKAVAFSFWILAPYIVIEAVRDLTGHHPAVASAFGIILTASSVIVMPVLGTVKRRLGQRLDSGATARPVDPVIALGIAAWSIWEGLRSWRVAACC
jgi:hypothetical protein